MPPRVANLLWEGADDLAQLAATDIEQFGHRIVDRDEQSDEGFAWEVFDLYPPVTWTCGTVWREFATRAFLDLGADLEQGVRPLPRSPAEEMALWLIIDRAELRAEMEPDDAYLVGGVEWDECREFLFEDHDVLLLFGRITAKFDDPENPLVAPLPDVSDYRPSKWFEDFSGRERHPSAESYEAACHRQHLDTLGRPVRPLPPRPNLKR